MADIETKRSKLFGRGTREIASFAILQPQRVTVHSAALRKVGERKRDERVSHVDDEWQNLAYEHADRIGEVGYVFNLKANLIARSGLLIQRFVNDEWVNEEGDDPEWAPAHRVMAAFVGPVGGVAELKRRFALHLGVAGETVLVGTPASDDAGISTGIYWEFLSTVEMRVAQGSKPTRNADGGQAVEVKEEVYTARCWRSSPRYSGRADSAMKRIATVCSGLLLLEQMVEAVSKSRLAAGILFVPDEMTLPSADDADESDDGDGMDPFSEEIFEHLTAPIEDRASASSLVHLLMRGPAEHGDKIRVIDLARNLDTWAKELRAEALDRIAAGLEVPKETMQGKSGLSGLGGGNVAALIDTDLIQRHVIPDGELMADFVTFAYLRPMLEAYEEMAQTESSTWRLVFDAGPIQTKSDEGTSARRLHSMSPDIVSNDSVRNANGFDDSDKPGDEEVQQRRMWELLKANPSTLGSAIGPMLVPGVDWAKIAEAQADNPVRDRSIPEDEPASEADTADRELSLLIERLTTAGDACLDRAYERAGTKVVTRCQKDPSLRDRTRSVPKHQVVSTLRASELAQMQLTPETLLEGAWEGFGVKARGWVRDYLEAKGHGSTHADDTAADASRHICVGLQRLATENLSRGLPPLSDGLRVQRIVMEKALANAGVLGLDKALQDAQ